MDKTEIKEVTIIVNRNYIPSGLPVKKAKKLKIGQIVMYKGSEYIVTLLAPNIRRGIIYIGIHKPIRSKKVVYIFPL